MPEASRQTDPSRVPALDLLRLAAVGAVILYHYGFWGPAAHGASQVALPWLAPIAQYGFLGVPVFFAISGFVIAYSAEGRTPVGFVIARFSRIYPTFVFCMTLTSACMLLFGGNNFAVTPAQWLANLFVAAPALGQPYVDTVYWSLVIEVVFYAWVAVLMAIGIFPRRIDAIVLAWLAITVVNELTIDSPVMEKLFMADDSGFFAVGLLTYEYYRGRRGARLCGMMALSWGTAGFQAVHRMEHLGIHGGGAFNPDIVAVITVVSLTVVFLATTIKRLPIPTGAVMAVGGITYPLYLLHMQLGYTILGALAPSRNIGLAVGAIVLGAVALAYIVWRFIERPAHSFVKGRLTGFADRLGWPSKSRLTGAQVQPAA